MKYEEPEPNDVLQLNKLLGIPAAQDEDLESFPDRGSRRRRLSRSRSWVEVGLTQRVAGLWGEPWGEGNSLASLGLAIAYSEHRSTKFIKE